MRARLFARFGPEQGLEVEFAGEATIGRGKDNTVLLTSREVSQQHARVFFDEAQGGFWVEDLGSLNGTRLDGEPIAGRERLSGLHVLTFGATSELFFVELAGEAEPAGETPRPVGEGTLIDAEMPTLPVGLRQPAARETTRADADPPTLPMRLRAAKDEPPEGGATRVEEMAVGLPAGLAGGGEAERVPGLYLELIDDPGGRFELAEGDNLVGRSGRARITLAHRELSRRHATLRVAGGRVWLRDEGSRNHTYLGEDRVDHEVEVTPGAELRFGRLRARLVAGAAPPDGAAGDGVSAGEEGR